MRRANWIVVGCGVLSLFGAAARGDGEGIVMIEESWQLTLGQPDIAADAPQVTMVMSPRSTLEGTHFIFELNHKTQPSYSAGGMQVQAWRGSTLREYKTGPKGEQLSQPNDVISWTQRMTKVEGGIQFEVVDGSSTNWGEFGNQGVLKIVATTGLWNLSDYRPSVSLEDSGVGFGGNRVSSLQLMRLRWQYSGGEVQQMVAPIDIDADLDP